jgi:hypothetical protein
MSSYIIRINDFRYLVALKLDEAIKMMEKTLETTADGIKTTITVETEEGYVMASVTNRRITALIPCASTGNGESCTAPKSVTFDMTAMVLQMLLDEIHDIKDAELSRSVCAFFGVKTPDCITLRAVNFARERENSKTGHEETITLEVKVKVKFNADRSLTDFMENFTLEVKPQVAGISVVMIEDVTVQS